MWWWVRIYISVWCIYLYKQTCINVFDMYKCICPYYADQIPVEWSVGLWLEMFREELISEASLNSVLNKWLCLWFRDQVEEPLAKSTRVRSSVAQPAWPRTRTLTLWGVVLELFTSLLFLMLESITSASYAEPLKAGQSACFSST